MTDGPDAQEERQGGGITLGHLLLAIAFFSPFMAVGTEIHRAGGGLLRYAAGILLATVLAAFIVWADWNVGKLLWARAQHHSGMAQNFLALGVFGLYFLSIVAGDIAGYHVASFLIHHVN